MMTVLGVSLPNQSVSNYLDALVGKIYKILPMKESNSAHLQQYIEWKLREMLAFKSFVGIVGEDPDFLTLLLLLYSVASQDSTTDTVRHDVFEAIRLCKTLSARYRSQEVMDDG